ncbi:MAG: hypothetical protein M3494_05645 [Actinomycetota bacterium]|nr:hypothetical protein [Actinomycetota bacterium]
MSERLPTPEPAADDYETIRPDSVWTHRDRPNSPWEKPETIRKRGLRKVRVRCRPS